MNKRIVIWGLACMAWAVMAGSGLGQVLLAGDAKLIGKPIKMEGEQIAFWKQGNAAEWSFKSAKSADQTLSISYSATRSSTMEVWLDGVKLSELEIRSTESWENYAEQALGTLSLSKGSHTLQLKISKGKSFCLNLRQAELSTDAHVAPSASMTSSSTSVSGQVLPAVDAKLIGKPIKIQDQQIAFWKQGNAAEWTFTSSKKADRFVVINYAAPQPLTMDVLLDGKTIASQELPGTGGWDTYSDYSLERVKLAKGDHILQLKVTKGNKLCVNLRHVVISPKKIASEVAVAAKPVVTSVPSKTESKTANLPPSNVVVYQNKGSWGKSLVAMRAAFKNKQISDPALSVKDGKSLWTDFAKECDWFLQDNQMHGDWGAGIYDARQDYAFYFQENRDNQLEKQLIEKVLGELGEQGAELRTAFDALVKKNISPDKADWLVLYEKACRSRRQIRLAELLKETDKVIYAKHHNMGGIYLATETEKCPQGSQLRIIDLSPEADGKPLTDELLFDSKNGIVRDPELSFDGKKMLFSWRKTNKEISTIGAMAPATGNFKIYEMSLADRSIRPLTTDATYGADMEPCYLPSGDILFSSVRCVHEVTCGWGDSCNMYIMDKDGNYARRLGFDQTQTGFQHMLTDGRILYTRRDYNDRGQSFAHALFVMNPDGTMQTEYYGNNSNEPTSYQHTRQIPNSNKTMGIAGGYHTTQGGKLITVDLSKGTQGYDGLEFYNWIPTPPEKIGHNENYCRTGEQYSNPYPFTEKSLLVSFSPIGTYLTGGSGLAKKKEAAMMQYYLYYMTLDGRRELLAADPVLSSLQAIPVRPRKAPPMRASVVDYTKSTGICYVQDVYYGPSAKGIERGTIKKLRVVKMFYKPITIGSGIWAPNKKDVGPGRKYSSVGMDSVTPTGVGTASFDTKEILGEVEVHEDGSAMFEVPAREPVYFQLIDKNGLVVQTMRSWATLMPNERFSCVGCHEENNSSPLSSTKTIAMQRPPQKIQPVSGLSGSAFSYAERVQPILNKHCVSCHAPGKKGAAYDLTDTIVEDGGGRTRTGRKFYQSYLTFLKVGIRKARRGKGGLDEGRPNEWVSYYTRLATVELTPPYYAGSTQSGVIKKMMDGHRKTKVSPEEIGVIAAWIDLNVPFVGEYDEMNLWSDAERAMYKKKLGMRHTMDALEQDNIKDYIEAGQP